MYNLERILYRINRNYEDNSDDEDEECVKKING